MAEEIIIVDYNLGNKASIANMLKRIGVRHKISQNVNEIAEASKLILPGVGHFDAGMRNLKELNLIGALENAVVKNKRPILGICLGMQLMTLQSEEGSEKGLGWLQAETKKFVSNQTQLKVPHMGWNYIQATQPNPLFDNQLLNRYYFVHSYYVTCFQEQDVIGTCNYILNFCCSFQRENIFGCQFHPEKSHRFGMQLMKQFAEL